MSFCEVKKFEGGIKVGLDFIDPAHEVYTWLPEENKWRFCGSIDFADGLLFMKRWRRHQHHIRIRDRQRYRDFLILKSLEVKK